jgi:hypothetical protein
MNALRSLHLQTPLYPLILCHRKLFAVFFEVQYILKFFIGIDQQVLEAFLAPHLLLKADGQLPVLKGAQIVQEGAVRVQVKRQVAGHREEMEEVDELLKGWAIPSMQGETLEALGEIG